MSIKKLQESIHKDNVDAGWWDDKETNEATAVASAIGMMHLVLSKSLEKVRKGGSINLDDIHKDIDLCMNRDTDDSMLVKIALMHSELSEATEYHLSGKNDDHLPDRKGEEVELADLVIRVLDYAEKKGYNIEEAIKEKREYNKHRKDHKLSERSKSNGKQF